MAWRARQILPALTAAWLVSGTIASAHPPPILSGEQEKGHAEEIIAWRKEMARVAATRDAARLTALYAPSFVHTDSHGHVTGARERIAAIIAGTPVVELAPAEALVVRVPGGWTAVATGKSKLRSGADKKSYLLAWTAVYVRAGQGWQLAGLQETRLKEVVP